ncbi:Alpha/Beta hydrolase protein [Aspergillus ambiguus]|uniref:alpha/beta fold hydrolase n=1 Tax=Aspergillus ambiguus TaxID=176160 RepID=UPI003CCD13FB
MASPNPLAPGAHQFFSPAKDLIFEYIVHTSTARSAHPASLITIQCPAWGLGSQYLQKGLAPLYTSHNHTCLFFHPRGTGKSSRPAHPHEMTSMPHLASDLEDLRKHLGIDRFPTLLGHSNGGAIALGYAEMYPTRVHRLILLNHQLIGAKDRTDLESVARNDERYREALDIARRDYASRNTDEEFTRSVDALWPVYFYDPPRYVEELRDAIGRDARMSLWCYRSVYGNDAKLKRPRQMVEGLEAVRAKTLMICGADDLVCRPHIAERTRSSIPGARVLVYDCCGHFPWIEQKDRTIQDIIAFVK